MNRALEDTVISFRNSQENEIRKLRSRVKKIISKLKKKLDEAEKRIKFQKQFAQGIVQKDYEHRERIRNLEMEAKKLKFGIDIQKREKETKMKELEIERQELDASRQLVRDLTSKSTSKNERF